MKRGFLLGPASLRAAARVAAPPTPLDPVEQALRAVCVPLGAGGPGDWEPVINAVRASGADIVLLGESTHGTHEYYAARSAITRRLVAELGFSGRCQASRATSCRAQCPTPLRCSLCS